MKKLLFTILMCGPVVWIGAETTDPDIGPAETQSLVIGADRAPITVDDKGMFVVQIGVQKWVFNDLKMAQDHALSAAGINRTHERLKVLDQIKNDLGLGDLERMAVGHGEPSYEQVKLYRGAKTDHLFALLENENFLNYRRRIAWIIGVVADEAAARKLADYISSPLPVKDEGIGGVDIRVREYGLWGLTLATRDQPMPWVKDFLIAHADVDQWMKSLEKSDIDGRAAKALAMTTIGAISRMAHDEPLAMLEEIRKRRLSKPSVRSLGGDSAAEKPDGEVTLEFIDVMINKKRRVFALSMSQLYLATPLWSLMKKLLFTLLISGPVTWVGAETTDPDEYQPVVGGTDRAPITVNDQGMFEVQVGAQKLVFDNLKRAQRTALSAAGINRAHERSKVRDQIKDDLGLGDLERIAVGSSRPSYDQVKLYRGAKTDQLFALLENEDFLNFRYRIAWIIGIVADEVAARKLADYISSPLPIKDGGSGGVDIRTREYGLLGLSLATRDQPMPWVKDFLIAHADADQWMKSLAAGDIDRRAAKTLAMTTIGTISRMAHDEPLAMLEEVRKRRLSTPPLRAADGEPATEKSDGEVTLEYIDVMTKKAQRIKEKRKSGEYSQ